MRLRSWHISSIKFFNQSIVTWVVAGMIILVTALFIFPPENLLIKQLSQFAVHWIFATLILGIFFLIVDNDHLLYISFAACGFMSLFLMRSYNTSLKLAISDNVHSVSVAFMNPSICTDDEIAIIQNIRKFNPDIVVLEEFTPDWLSLSEEIKNSHPNFLELMRIDPLGKAIYSKNEIFKKDTFDLALSPVIYAGILTKGKDTFYMGACNLLPPITLSSYRKLSSYLDTLSQTVFPTFKNNLLCANLNIIPWSGELLHFKAMTNMASSRRDNNLGQDKSSFFGIFNAPKNEILFSETMECAMFQVMKDSHENPFGIFGRYQIR
ncbi:MAG: endonuclease/exonuclease/phosphatase family protein [Saprospiraceae bacterium]|nr:endonuclease/exonuclease/phosphatase family protein [Saprospiraceae bacterium]MBK9379569.1 endonuclease/exonuclease/phosphatase family protein [Saprospiraceae bacterium]